MVIEYLKQILSDKLFCYMNYYLVNKNTLIDIIFLVVFKILQMFSILSVIRCSCDRVFSKLNIVKNKFKSTK
jgi:hypothetical protein